MRAIAPVMAGASRMPFLFGCNVIGGLLWGAWVPRYLLGGIGFVHPHIELILIAVVVASGLPLFLSFRPHPAPPPARRL